MILVASQRGGARDLGLHLLKPENDHVTVHELSGFVDDDLQGALKEVQAVAKGTRCKQFLFSCSLNPPATENVPTEVFEAAVNRIAERLGLSDQPRVIVFHEKEGRRHAHVVISRIHADADGRLKAIPLPFFQRKLMDLSRELHVENGWKMPRGMATSKERDLRNFSLEEWQQAKRARKDVREIKAAFQDSWATSDTRQAFAAALEERGYKLAKGDRRSLVAVDHKGEVYAVAKWVGLKTSAVKSRLGDGSDLPSVADRIQQFSEQIAGRLGELKQAEKNGFRLSREVFENERQALVQRQQQERKALIERQKARSLDEAVARQARYKQGLRGIVDRLTGHRRRVDESNQMRAYLARLRDRKELDELIFAHGSQRRDLTAKGRLQAERYKMNRRDLRSELAAYLKQMQPPINNKETMANERERRKRRHGPGLLL